jgi:hypothetical protein
MLACTPGKFVIRTGRVHTYLLIEPKVAPIGRIGKIKKYSKRERVAKSRPNPDHPIETAVQSTKMFGAHTDGRPMNDQSR